MKGVTDHPVCVGLASTATLWALVPGFPVVLASDAYLPAGNTAIPAKPEIDKQVAYG